MAPLYSRRLAPWLLLSPVLLLGTVFYAAPIGFSLGVSLTGWNALGPPHWAGVSNYRFLLEDGRFLQSLWTTFLLAAGSALIGIPAALALALAITAGHRRAAWRTIFWLPAITNVVAAAYAWQSMLDPTYGPVDRLLSLLGIAGPDWLQWPDTAILSVAAAIAWMTLGHNILLFSTGIEAIDPAVLEAARIDGGSGLQTLRYVILPLLGPTTLFVLVTTLIASIGSFALVLVMTNGGPGDSTLVTSLYTYRIAFESLRLGRASAAGVLLAVLTLLLALPPFRLLGRDRLRPNRPGILRRATGRWSEARAASPAPDPSASRP